MNILYNECKIILTPNGYKAGKLYAIKGADATLVRASTATRENASGATETMGVNVPLIDYSGAGDCLVFNVISRKPRLDFRYKFRNNIIN